MTGDELVARPARGRVFSASVRVRLADISRSGRLRLDSIARLLQDVASDDAADAGQEPDRAWVVRRMVLEVDDDRAAPLGDDLTLATWCSGVGARWAERRTDIERVAGGVPVVRVAALWVLIDVATGRPVPLGAHFDAHYAAAAAGRRVGQRLRHPSPPADATRTSWALRVADFDVLGHMNNAAYWAPVEQILASRTGDRGRRVARAEIEFRDGVDPGEPVDIVRPAAAAGETAATAAGESAADDLRLWLVVGDDVRASIVVGFAPADGSARRF